MSSPSNSPSTPSPSGRPPERRIHRRVPIVTAAFIMASEQRFAADCLNVSMGGAAVRTHARARTGSIVHLELSLGADNSSVSIQCEVVRSTPTELGLRFMALDRPSLEAILSLL